jgi:hypothetical protein
MGKKSGSGIRILDEQSESYIRELRNHCFGLKYLKSLMWIWDPGSKMKKKIVQQIKRGSDIWD